MFKKLDKLILKAFMWPFVATFFITLFVFMMQILWKYIDDLVGKGLDFITLTKFLIYASATLVTLAMPIAILLSSIMTFGKLGENFELVAIKSSGISLLRFMRPLFFVSILLTGVAFLFANYIAPVANLKFAVIYNDIYRKSPAFDLKDGVFYNGFRGFSIKVGKKEKDKSTLHNVLIYEQSNGIQDNTIISESGKMTVSADKKFLEFHLQNGQRYSEKGEYNSANNEYVQMGFKEYNKLFDLTQLNIQKTSDSLFMNNMRMKTLRLLDKDIDSLKKIPDSLIRQNRSDLKAYIQYTKYRDSTRTKKQTEVADKIIINKKVKSFDDLIPDSLKTIVRDQAMGTVSSIRSLLEVTGSVYDNQVDDIIQHKIEWHKKLSLSIACMVLFFIGAPLGSIIRKGGLGLPLVVALIFFMIFYLLNIFGEKFTKDHLLVPTIGMWLPVIILTPVGFFLTYKAMHDSQLFNKEFYYRLIKNIKSRKRKFSELKK
ncbi:YjgP/YjgQ family permease [Ginsengibacter hankyongi]|uniref:YjgP/YjgQ family permease n=1 Tax=Ginsengibacter hankyongi TaxID=2607284 RepID=A0A5J5IKE1_9BACT|nr:LptF/LptG family permease [Ginsengibacter hankyongi]KAA9039157.1 YjgP/YjgQ family permease [Ginsengibacter hankyongi]